ncbi:hypothetical protein BN988_00060 [Oceanobacillus picturae]|uniref:Prepilin-type N-terminal cleavage/methylation domain-containing protein n=1 Tax=Oceanobacillus picturae TaxID=171693 RepID=W9B4I0_9BACI|nr:prepilin-type N-terminal cleavage/methylation domain-containing protein [Oceanobacillus picturae]CDO01625.1 hypothetical protein BN988_00060 [Oceanobacillus picturae]
MNFRQLHNEKGITLVELLAALGLLAIVITLSAGVLMQLLGSEEEASANISLKQNTNVLLSEMRNQFTEGRNICYDGEHGDLEVVSINLTNGEQELTEENGCFTNANNSEAMQVKLTVKSKTDKTYTTETTWNKSEPYNLAIQLENSDDIDDVENDEEDYSPGEEGDCDYYGNTKFSRYQIGEWNSCLNPTVHDGSAWIINNISIFQKIKFTIDHNLFTDQSLNLEQNANLIVKKSAKLSGPATIKRASNLSIGGHLIAEDNMVLQESTTTQIGKDANFKNGLKLMGNASLDVNGSFSSQKDLNLQENNSLKVGKNGIFFNNVNMMGNATLEIKGDARFHKSLHFQENSIILVEGNAIFDGPITPEWGAGTMCIKGEAEFKQPLYSNLKVLDTAKQCFSPGGYNIYQLK